MGSIKVVVAGAGGRMGREVVKAVLGDPGLELVGAVDPAWAGEDAGVLAGVASQGLLVESDLEKVLAESGPDVLVDFTLPEIVWGNLEKALKYGVRAVVGTTGLSSLELQNLDELFQRAGLGLIVAPNFAIGAILLMHFARLAARYFPHVEIIELHHDRKLDAPSGTAIKTAELISESRQAISQGHPDEVEKIPGVRGGEYEGIRVHSVRLPGLVAHQEVIFGGLGQTLTLRHDSLNRESFMPGVLLAIKKVMEIRGLVYGLEKLLGFEE